MGSLQRSTRLALLLLLVAGLLVPVQAQTTSNLEFQLFRPAGEEFQILIPKDPVQEVTKFPYHRMELTTRLYMSGNRTGPLFAVASLSGIKSDPASYTEFQRLNSYVDAFKDWFPAKVRGKEAKIKLNLVGEKTLNGHVGREYSVTLVDLVGTAQVYATKRRFYAVIVLNSKKDEELQERFFSSFVIPEKVVEPPAQVAQQPAETPAPSPSPAPTEEKKADEKKTAETNKTDAAAEPATAETKPAEASEDKNAPPGQKKPISGGVLNGKALYMPKPDYPPEAQSVKASGSVVVQITIDEVGAVIAAKAVSGHPTLHQVCVNAALQAKFSPTTLMGEPVKVSGVLTYNFVQ
jgi:TonB family protein